MTDFATLEKMVLSFPETSIEPHFEKISFRIRKKIFATYDAETDKLTVKLSEDIQTAFCESSRLISPVDNKWGKQGWTYVYLNEAEPSLIKQVLFEAFCQVAPKNISNELKNKHE